jgi:hypothetical protein
MDMGPIKNLKGVQQHGVKLNLKGPDRSPAHRRRAKAFVLIDGELYNRGATGILMRRIPRDQGRELLQEIHAGTCGHHAGPRTLIGKAFRQGF